MDREGVAPSAWESYEAAASLDVLVVDDHAATRSGIAKAVRGLGHVCREAVDGDDAWQMLEAVRADVVISDWQMPGLSGPELCRRLRAASADAPYTYFILMTGYHDRAQLLGAMSAGADDFQRKPVDVDELEARLVSASRVVALHRRLAAQTSALRRDSATLFAASRTDALTEVGNRLRMDEELATACARAQRYGHRYSLAICDLDRFKDYNDARGHLAGDRALREVSAALSRCLRRGDSVYRYGGEEFVVLLPEQDLLEATLAVERIRAEVEGLAIAAPASVLTLSAGVAQLDAVDDSPATWLGRADEALYAAKAAGRNRVRTNPSSES